MLVLSYFLSNAAGFASSWRNYGAKFRFYSNTYFLCFQNYFCIFYSSFLSMFTVYLLIADVWSCGWSVRLADQLSAQACSDRPRSKSTSSAVYRCTTLSVFLTVSIRYKSIQNITESTGEIQAGNNWGAVKYFSCFSCYQLLAQSNRQPSSPSTCCRSSTWYSCWQEWSWPSLCQVRQSLAVNYNTCTC